MNSHDARPAVTIANKFGAYRPLLPRVERGLQGAARLLASFVGGLGLRLGSHDRGPPVQAGAAKTARAQKRNRSSGASPGAESLLKRYSGRPLSVTWVPLASLVVLRPFKAGDAVTAGGVTGTVVELGLFATTINTPDNVRTTVGNNKIFSDTIANFTANPFRRVELKAQLDHSGDTRKAMEVLKARMSKIANVKQEPAPEPEKPDRLWPENTGAVMRAHAAIRPLLAAVDDSAVEGLVRPWVWPRANPSRRTDGRRYSDDQRGGRANGSTVLVLH